MNSHLIFQAAVSAAKAGVSVVPPRQDGSKAPDSSGWKEHQNERASLEQIAEWYSTPRTGVGWVCGKVSGGLTVIDFDDRSAYREFVSVCQQLGLGDLWSRIEAGYLEHSPNGAHVAFRCERCDGNVKLAKRGSKAVIETRGEGGYIVVAPSYGGVNASGPYVLQRGGVESIVTITPDELEQLFRAAKAVGDEQPKIDTERLVTGEGSRPGDDFNERATWAEVLGPHEWREIFSRNGVTHWRRPGKALGVSATTGYANTDYLYVFTTSTVFQAERGYSKFSAYALLNHGGDFSAASSDLRLLGYGIDNPDDDVDISGIMEQLEPRAASRGIPRDLLSVPGALGELAEWITRTGTRPQPELALGASIAALSAVIGRKVQGSTRLRPNVYILGVAASGGGKERAREAIRQIYAEIGRPEIVSVDSIASDAGIESAIERCPSSLFLLDEFGLLLSELAGPRAPSHVHKQKSLFLRLFSASSSDFYGKTHANKDHDRKVIQPSLSIYGTTTPQLLDEGMGSTAQAEGLFSRLLVFRSGDDRPARQGVDTADAESPPERVVEVFRAWSQASIAPGAEGNLEGYDGIPRPLVVPDSPEAQAVFARSEAELEELEVGMIKHGIDPAPYARISEYARKLALIRACGESASEPEVTAAGAQWACDLVTHLTQDFLRHAEEHSASSEFERLQKMVLRKLKESRGWCTKREISRTLWRHPRRLRDQVLDNLLDAGKIKSVKKGNSVRYRTTFL